MTPSLVQRVRGLLGLVTLGEGLFILLRVVPHEAPLLGALLVALGALLLWRAELPQLDGRWADTGRWAVGAMGALAALGVLAYDAARHAPLDPPKVAILVLGLATAAAAPWRRAATPMLWSVPLAWAPLGVWAAQGAMEALAGGSLFDAFVRYGLLLPMAAVLALLGRAPTIHGQVIAYQTGHGGLMALQVGVACSGLQAMALFAGVLAVYLVALRPPPREGLAWSVVGLAGVYVVNVARLVALSLIGSAWGSDALERAHAQAGWIVFVAWTAAFAAMAMRPRTRAPAASPPSAS